MERAVMAYQLNYGLEHRHETLFKIRFKIEAIIKELKPGQKTFTNGGGIRKKINLLF